MEPPVWSTVDDPHAKLSAPRWNHAACSVMAIPSWKLFVFGGTSGESLTGNRVGCFLADGDFLLAAMKARPREASPERPNPDATDPLSSLYLQAS